MIAKTKTRSTPEPLFRWRLVPGFVVLISTIALTIPLTVNITLAAPLASIQQRGKLIVGVKDNLPPLGFYDVAGNLQGLEIDIARELARDIFGDPEAVVLVPISNQERLLKVVEGEVDLVIAQLAATPSRARVVDLSDYYYLDTTVMISKKGAMVEGVIAVLSGGDAINVVESQLPGVSWREVKSYQEALQLLEAGSVAGFVGDRTVMVGWIQEYPQYQIVKEFASIMPLSIAMPKGLQYLELQQQVDKSLTKLQRSGWLKERINHWGL